MSLDSQCLYGCMVPPLLECTYALCTALQELRRSARAEDKARDNATQRTCSSGHLAAQILKGLSKGSHREGPNQVGRWHAHTEMVLSHEITCLLTLYSTITIA